MTSIRSLVALATIGASLACGAQEDPLDGGADDAGADEDGAAHGDSGHDAAVDATADAETDAGPPPIEPAVVLESRCGLDFRWLPPSQVGRLVSFDTPHSTLTTGEAAAIQLALLATNVSLSRPAVYETLAHRIVYTTQDRGVEREVTGLVILPEVGSTETLPVLLWLHGTTGMNDSCSPTFDIEDRESDQYAVAEILSVLSSYGYIVVAPDYLGQKSVGPRSPALHPYLIGEPTAIASLDAVHAARELSSTVSGPRLGPIAVYGASQGGHAAFFTVLYARHYAPELDIGAAVYVVPPSDLSAHMARGIFELSPPSGNAVLFLAGANAWYEPASGLSEVLVSPYDEQVPVDVADDCRPSTFDEVSSTAEVFTERLRGASSRGAVTGPPPWQCYAVESSVTRTALPPSTIPGLVILGEDDTLVDTAIEREAFVELCRLGHNLDYLECAGAPHGESFFYSIDDALDFVDAQLAEPTAQECVIRPAETCSNELLP